ncbi:hypothetical protein ABT167_37765 [Streptomyces sp. NPDC001792]|uniref:hypothetical protein n=1 Tax=Streptomyces sp. NPDC001792 TaxID=3154524 RepID=UPI00332C537C
MTDRHPETAQHDASPGVGAVMVDRRNGRVGVGVGYMGPYVQLRPPRGGREWDVPPEDVRSPTPAEELSAKVGVVNRRWGR